MEKQHGNFENCNTKSRQDAGNGTANVPIGPRVGNSKEIVNLIKQYLSQHPANYEPGIESLLEQIYFCYMDFNPVENSSVRKNYNGLLNLLHGLALGQISCTEETEEQLIDYVNAACSEYEREAFIEGMKVGARAILELMESK